MSTSWLLPFGGLLAQSSLPEWLSGAWYLILVLAGFSVVVFFHELGHFLAARWAGVRVERFAIGFGRELFGITRGQTRYSFNILPLGGYVKMLGQEDFAVDKEGELKVRDNPDSFTSKPVGQRMVIVSAGVIMNLLFAAVAFGAVMMIGQASMPAVVGYVDPTSAAMRAGVQAGDRILAVNTTPIRSFEDLFHAVTLSDQNEELELTIERDGKIVEPKPRVMPEYKPETALRQIGLSMPMGRRVFGTPSRLMGFTPSNEVRPNDLLTKVGSGRDAREARHLGSILHALADARGMPIELTVARPTQPVPLEQLTRLDAEVPSQEVTVQASAVWVLLPAEGGDTASCSLLGLTPRLVAGYVEPGSAADLGGMVSGDVIVRIGHIESPSHAELRAMVEANADRDLVVVVRRRNESKPPLSAAAVWFLTGLRERLIEIGRDDLAAARALLEEQLQSAELTNDDRASIRTMARVRQSATEWLAWLEAVDTHTLFVRPMPRRGWFSADSKPAIGVQLWPWEEDRIVIGDVRDTLRGRTSPARKANVRRGSVVVAVDDEPVSRWAELTEALRRRAGTTVRLRTRLGEEYATLEFPVPADLTTRLNLPPDATVTEIGGATTAEIETAAGRRMATLPDWQVVEALLRRHVGETVTVKWSLRDGRTQSAELTVTEGETDPWLMRVTYAPPFQCYPLREVVRETNPIKALWMGSKRAYSATIQTYLTIKHLIFTREVGVQNVSGPVGILRRGSQIAEGGLTNLIWFLGIISANLAVINFLPMPIVDGGLFIFLLLEKIRGEPVSIRTQVVTQLIGIALIVSIFLIVTFQDIANWNR